MRGMLCLDAMTGLPDQFWSFSARVLALVAAGAVMAALVRALRCGSAAARASLWRRTFVWLGAAVAVLALAGAGAVLWALFVGLVSFQAAREVAQALRLCGHPIDTGPAILGAWAPLLVPLDDAQTAGWALAGIVALAALAAASVRSGQRGLGAAGFITLYIGVPMALLAGLRRHDGGFALVVWTLAVPWVTDVAAMYGGMLLGRRPLAPRMSPAKTVEGTLIGLAASVCTAALFRPAFPAVPWPAYMAAAIMIGVAGIVGGLVASAIKRAAQIKDYGAALPGHGGVMDRIDGVLFAVPATWLLVAIARGW